MDNTSTSQKDSTKPRSADVSHIELHRLESGDLNDGEVIDLFQRLVDNGMAWSLQGSYGRTAARLIELGLVEDTHGAITE